MKITNKITSLFLVWAILIWPSIPLVNASNTDFTATTAEEESYWYSRYNLWNLVMRSGMWEQYMPDKEMIMMAMKMVDSDFNKEEFMKWNTTYGDGDHPMPPINPYLIKSVYKSWDPHYTIKMDPDDFATQKRDESKMDKTLTPKAFGYTIQKEVEWAKDFHWDGHFGKATSNFGSQWRFLGMIMTMNAKMQAKYAMENMDELKKNASTYWHFVMLWAISDLAGMLNDDTFESNTTNRYQDKESAKKFLSMADMIFKEGYNEWLLPTTIKEYGVAIKSLVWYAKVTENNTIALKKIVEYSNKLTSMQSQNAWEEAYRLLGLIEANRVAWVNWNITKEASQKFLDSFDTTNNLFKGQNTYSIDEVWAIIWALNEIKLFVVSDTEQSEQVFKDFFETVVNKAWLIQSAPPLSIAKSEWEYSGEPKNYFRYPTTMFPPMAGGEFGIAPVFASEVSFTDGKWKVTNANFDSAWAMHASNEMIWLHNDELNGFQELYKLTSKDKTLLMKFKPIILRLSPAKKELIASKFEALYQKNATNPRLIKLLKGIETMLK